MSIRPLQLCGTGALGALLILGGCHKANSPEANDPANANLAPAGSTGNNEPGAPQYGSSNAPAGSSQQASGSMPPPPPEDTGYNQNSAPSADNSGYADQYAGSGYGDDSDEYADSAPPPLPDYQQPPCPGDNYLWTPGYWDYASAGYYWVPGVWVVAPFIGALWTPGYWGFAGNRYGWHPGYWGDHIGFYGGVSYGNGYYGNGYEGGYWNHGQFFYNRSVTRIEGGNIRNVYEHSVPANNNRVSFNGGNGGIGARPSASDLAAAREQHFAASPAQQQHVEQARASTGQYSHGGAAPANLAAARPLAGRTASTATATGQPPGANPATTRRPRPPPTG